jgi:acetyl-CoA carboxylase carboxyltransferase component
VSDDRTSDDLSHPDTASNELDRRRARTRDEMGGAGKVATLAAAGLLNARQRVDAFLDPGTFVEVGMHVHSARQQDAATTPGDGKVTGYGRVDGRSVAIGVDDTTVKSGTSSMHGGRKIERIYEQALRSGMPFVFLGECGGGRIPDIMPSDAFSRLAALPLYGKRVRRIPSLTMISGNSHGGSSFHAALSDVVVQVRGSCMSVTSPRVVEAATGEIVTPEALGGVDVNSKISGQTDIVADTEGDGLLVLRELLGLLPANAGQMPPRREPQEPAPGRPLDEIVSVERRRGYDVRRVLAAVLDEGRFIELGGGRDRGVITALGRIDGYPLGVIASQPLHHAGAVGGAGCDKMTRLILLCDSFNLPLVFLQDTPGLMVGLDEEHERLLFKGMLLQQALVNSSVPKLTVVLRKAYGLAHHLLAGCNMGADMLVSWPNAEFGFMDPGVGANVLFGRELAALDEPQRTERRNALAEEMRENTSVWGPAGAMSIDDVIHPNETRAVLVAHLRRLMEGRVAGDHAHHLANWPTSW